jgi:hypothetical protein
MNFSTLTKTLLLLFTCCVPIASTQAQTANSSSAISPSSAAPAGQTQSVDCVALATAACDLNATEVEIAPPDSPAFTVLGLNPTNISRPTTVSAIVADALNAFDDNGHFQSGTAINTAPFLVFAAKSYSLGEYGESSLKAYFVRLLSRSSLSFATVKGTSTPDTSIRLASGLRVGLIDLGDPRASFHKCVGEINTGAINPSNPNAPLSDTVLSAIKACRAAKPAWNATSLTIAGAPAWISTDGSTSNLKRNGGGAWVSFAYGIKDKAQIIANARRETGQSVVPASTSQTSSSTSSAPAFVLQDSTIAGGSVKFGRGDFNGIVSGLYIGKRTNGIADSYPEFGFGLERKLGTGVYLELNYRYDVGSRSASGVLTSLKWSFSQKPKLAN